MKTKKQVLASVLLTTTVLGVSATPTTVLANELSETSQGVGKVDTTALESVLATSKQLLNDMELGVEQPAENLPPSETLQKPALTSATISGDFYNVQRDSKTFKIFTSKPQLNLAYSNQSSVKKVKLWRDGQSVAEFEGTVRDMAEFLDDFTATQHRTWGISFILTDDTETEKEDITSKLAPLSEILIQDKKNPAITGKINEDAQTTQVTSSVSAYVDTAPSFTVSVSDDGEVADLEVKAFVDDKEVTSSLTKDGDSYTLPASAVEPKAQLGRVVKFEVTDPSGNKVVKEFPFNTAYKNLLKSTATFTPTTGMVDNKGVGYGDVAGTFAQTNNFTLEATTFENEAGTALTGNLPVGIHKVVAVTDSGFKFPTNLTIEIKEDSEAPKTSIKAVDVQNQTKDDILILKGATGRVAIKVSDENGLNTVSLKANGTDVLKDEAVNGQKTFIKELPVTVDSTFEVTATDVSGKTFTKTYIVKVDNSTYDILNATGIMEEALKEGKLYIKEDKKVQFELTGDYRKILDVNGDQVPEDGYTVAKSGNYNVTLTNIWGEKVNKNLVKLLTGTEGSVVYDTEAPVSTLKASESPVIVDDLPTFSTIPTIKVASSDNEKLRSIVVTVNGTKVNDLSDINATTNSVDVDFTGVSESKVYRVEVLTTDYAGNSSSLNYVFAVDANKPRIDNVEITTPVGNIVGDKVFVPEAPKVKVDASAGFTGLDTLTLNGSDFPIGEATELTNLSGGELIAYNTLGVASDSLDLMTALGYQGKTFVVDTQKPSGELKLPNLLTAEGLNWLTGKDGDAIVSLKDNEGIQRAVLKVNGVEVLANAFTEVITSGDMRVSLSDIDLTDSNIFELTVTDFAGNVYEAETTVRYDTTQPEITGVRLVEGQLHEYTDGLYTNKLPKIEVDYRVGGAGLSTILINGKVNKGNTFTLAKGKTQTVSVVDKLDRVSPEKNVLELLGFPEGKPVILDKATPTVETTSKNAVTVDDKLWVTEGDKVVDVTVTDNTYLKNLRVSVNNTELQSVDFTEDTANWSGTIDLTKVEPNTNGTYNVLVEVQDRAGNVQRYTETYYIDKTAPKIVNFDFIQEGYKEGRTLVRDSDVYGFFFANETTVRVRVDDDGLTSGLKEVTLSLKGNKEQELKAPVTDGFAEFTIPADFKGWVSAVTVDNVGHTSEEMTADGVITETANWHVSTSKVDIQLPETPYRTADGQPLYANDFTANGSYTLPVAGVSGVAWSTGASGYDNKQTDKNLATAGTTSTQVAGNANGMSLKLEVTDKAGHKSASEVGFAIDKDAPQISVAWSQSNADNLYSSARVGTITIVERNFNPQGVSVTGLNQGLSWASNGDMHTATVTFAEDGVHQFSITATDLAGNTSQTYQSEKFDVDTTAPVITVDMSGTASNGNYFNAVRTATINVNDRHFDASKMQVTGGDVSWSATANGGVGIVTFGEGEHSLTVTGSDALGHAGNTVTVDKFIVDTTLPNLVVSGVSDGGTYTDNVFPDVTFSDKFLDNSKVSVTLRGRRIGTVVMQGSVASGRFFLDGLPNGDYDDVYEMTIHVEDLAGNVVDKTVTFSLKRDGSKYNFDSSDVNGGFYKSLPKDLVLSETSVSRLDTSRTKFTYTLNGQVKDLGITPQIRESQNALGYWVYEYIFPKDAFTQNGLWGISVTTVDVNGKSSSSDGSVSINFVIDDTAPTITLLDLKDDGIYYEATKRVQILVSDNIGVTSATVKVNGEEFEFTKEELEAGQKEIELQQSEDLYDIEVVAKDRTGNAVSKSVKSVFVTSSPIEILVTSSEFKGLRWLGIGALGAGVASIFGWWYLAAKKRRKEEEDLEREAREASTNNLDTDKSKKTQ